MIPCYSRLPTSLEKLIRAFASPEMANYKGMFPHKFSHMLGFDWKYIGAVPGLKYFFGPKSTDLDGHKKFRASYLEYCGKYLNHPWEYKRELTKYCENDVKALHQVLIRFGQLIYDTFDINFLKYPTLPSLALAIFRRNYLGKVEIPIVTGDIEADIRKSYYGGFNDVYRPYAENVTSYDVNSLYPSVMAKNPMPLGAPEYVEGENLKLEDFFGFVKVRVTCPRNLHTPILPFKDGLPPFVTRYPVGNWTGWYFTEELKNAEKYGYTFVVPLLLTLQKQRQKEKGYKFRPGVVFAGYVGVLYDLKMNSEPRGECYIRHIKVTA